MIRKKRWVSMERPELLLLEQGSDALQSAERLSAGRVKCCRRCLSEAVESGLCRH